MVTKINKNNQSTVFVDKNDVPIKGFFFVIQSCKNCGTKTKHKIEFENKNGHQIITSVSCTNCR